MSVASRRKAAKASSTRVAEGTTRKELQRIAGMHPDLMERVRAATVTHHPYGFYIVPTGAMVDGIGVRFHVWLPGIRRVQEPHWPPHTHRSTMRSFVLLGRLENAIWDRYVLGDGAPIYYIEIGGTGSVVRKSPIDITLGEPKLTQVEEGHSYEVPKGVFHDTRVKADKACVTLCHFYNDRIARSLVVGEREKPDEIASCRLDLDRDEAEQARAWCLKALGRYL